ncbi:MAG: bifunctional UDP-N-acetylglucosamine diphosphorylase/glucosamine-1-phosphate N-acetyltransferase GlmU [Oscillospiraceae bacterium]
MQQIKNDTCCVILAAGMGKRMHSAHSKVLCEVAFKPMIRWVVDAARAAGISGVCAVVGDDDVKAILPDCKIEYQTERLGTGHAVMCARGFLENCEEEHVLVLCGDAPFIDRETILGALSLHKDSGAAVTAISARLAEPAHYGRIVRESGDFSAIVEYADCTQQQLQINEINSGAYWFKKSGLLFALDRIKNDNAQGEYYITDAVAILAADGQKAVCYEGKNETAVLGANNAADLLELNEAAKKAIISRHLENGVSFVSTDGIVISPDAVIEAGAQILPGTLIKGKSFVGKGAVIGPNSILENTEIGERTVFNASQGYESRVGADARIGPYVHLRPDSIIEDSVKIGDFVEVKNSRVGEGTSLAHLTYIGDSDIGRFCNFGCGVVVVNYDGVSKFRTIVGDYAFIGCNTNLIAPVKIGNGAYTGAATTVTQDVPDGALAVGRARQTNIEGWAAKKLQKYIEKKQKH